MTDGEDLVLDFEAAAIAYGTAVGSSDLHTINQQADRMVYLSQRISRDEKLQTRFLELLTHPEPYVRLMTATFGLKVDEISSTRALYKLIKSGTLRFEAEQCLQRWMEGEWALDVPQEALEPQSPKDPLVDVDDPLSMARSLGYQVPLAKVTATDELDMRLGCINVYFVNIVGLTDGFVEFCPNNDPPSEEELLAWLWLIQPETKKCVLELLGDHDFAEGIRQFV